MIEQMVTITIAGESLPEADRRYRVLVLLNRSDRPRYYTYLCYQCGFPVCEIVNQDVVAEADSLDMSNVTLLGTGVRCDGRYQGGKCRIWYYFSLGQ